MKRFAFRLIILATLLVLILPVGSLAAATGPVNSFARPDVAQRVYLPMIGKNTSFLPPIIPETTNVLDAATTQHLAAVSPDGATYTFDQNTAALQKLAPGEIMVSAPTDLMPYGFLRQVAAINTSGSQVVVQTQPATLEDAIQQGEILVDQKLSAAGMQAQEIAPGMILRPASLTMPDAAFFLEIKDVVLVDEDGNLSTTDDQIVANGSIEFEPEVHFLERIGNGKAEVLRSAIDIKETADLKFQIRVTKPLVKTELPLGKPIYLQPIVGLVGPFPVVIVPVLTFQVGIDGAVHVGVMMKVTQTLSASAGLLYNMSDKTWTPISSLNNQPTWLPPVPDIGVDAKMYASTRLQLLFYGLVGAYFETGPFIKFESNTFATPWWQLYWGFDATAGVRADVLGHKEIASKEIIVMGVKFPLAQAQDTPPPPTGDMVLVPAGTFRMGCDPAHNGGYSCFSLMSCRCTRYIWTRTASTGRK